MNEDSLRTDLGRLATLAPPGTVDVHDLWRSGRTGRRRRTAAIAVAVVAVVAVSTIGALSLREPGGVATPQPPASGGPTSSPPTTTTKTFVVEAPTTAELRQLPVRTSRFTGIAMHADGPPLSKHPLARALAAWWAGGHQPVHVLGANGADRVVDSVTVEDNVDAGGNPTATLVPHALSPEGNRLVIVAPGRLRLVDVTTGSVHDIPLSGETVDVAWLPHERLAVNRTSGGGSLLVDVAHARVIGPNDYYPADIDSQGRIVQLMTQGNGTGPPPEVRTVGPTNVSVAVPYVTHWSGGAFVNGSMLASAAQMTDLPRPSGEPYSGFTIEAVDLLGSPSRALLIDADGSNGHRKGCCSVAGWLDADTIVVFDHDVGLWSWNVRSDEFGLLSLAKPWGLSLAK